MDRTGEVCNGSSTVEADLAAVWAVLKADWAKLSSEDQATLVGSTADEGGSDAEKVMARYDEIIKSGLVDEVLMKEILQKMHLPLRTSPGEDVT